MTNRFIEPAAIDLRGMWLRVASALENTALSPHGRAEIAGDTGSALTVWSADPLHSGLSRFAPRRPVPGFPHCPHDV
jgi:hypothetical protein